MSLLRFNMLERALEQKAVEVTPPSNNPSDYFGEKVFGRKQMRKFLNKQTFEALIATIENNTPLTQEVADAVKGTDVKILIKNCLKDNGILRR